MKTKIRNILKVLAYIAIWLMMASIIIYAIYKGDGILSDSNKLSMRYDYQQRLTQQNDRIKDSLIYQIISTQRPKQVGWLHNSFLPDMNPESFDITYSDFQLCITHQPLIPYQKKESWEYFCTLINGTDICVDDKPYLGSPLKDRTYEKIKEICMDIKKQAIDEQ
jgi:hypothetical protein